jgi:hypothetical protein
MPNGGHCLLPAALGKSQQHWMTNWTGPTGPLSFNEGGNIYKFLCFYEQKIFSLSKFDNSL